MTQDSQLPSQRTSLVLEPADEQMSDATQRRRRQALALLRGRWHWAILLALVLGGSLGAAGYYFVTPVYTSLGSISIAPDQRPGTEVVGGIPLYDRFLEVQADRMRSQTVIEAAMNHEAWQAIDGGSAITQEDVRSFSRKLSIEVPRNEQQLTVSFTDATPEQAAAGVESMIAGYIRIFSQQVSRVDNERLRKLENQRDQLQRELTSLQTQRTRLLNEAGGPGVTERLQRLWEQLWNVEDMIGQTRRQLEAAQAMEQGEQPAIAVNSVQEIAQQDGHMRQLLNQRQALQSQIQTSNELNLGRRHRHMESLRAELDAVNRQIQEYAREYSNSPLLRAQIPDGDAAMGAMIGSPDELRVRIQDLEQVHERVDAEAASLGQTQMTLTETNEQIETAKNRLRLVENDIRSQKLKPSDASRVEIISDGEWPDAPSNDSKRKQLAAMGGLGGAAMGVGLVMLVGLLDRRFRRVDDAELTLPTTRMLGILPTLPENLADPAQAATAAHCVHHIRTMLQIGDTDHHGHVLTITSPAPGSGKTSLASALGVSFAASGAETLIIDCDVIGGGLSRRLGIAAHPALEDILRREGMVSEQALAEASRAAEVSRKPLGQTLVEMGYIEPDALDRAKQMRKRCALGLFEACDGEPFENCVADTGVDNLYLLPIGDAIPEQAGSLSPSAIQRLLNKARGRFDTVLIDTGPILGSIEASMTAAEADATVLAVSRGDQKAMVIKSLHALQSVEANVAGVVFNHATLHDVHRSSYASVASGQGEAVVSARVQPIRIDPETSARFGPLGSAVASYSRSHRHDLPPDEVHNSSGNGAGPHA